MGSGGIERGESVPWERIGFVFVAAGLFSRWDARKSLGWGVFETCLTEIGMRCWGVVRCCRAGRYGEEAYYLVTHLTSEVCNE